MNRLQFVCSVVSRTKKSVKWLVKLQVLTASDDEVKVTDLHLLSWATVVLRNNLTSLSQVEVEKKLPVRCTGEICWVVTDAEDKALLHHAIHAVAGDWGGYSSNISVQIF